MHSLFVRYSDVTKSTVRDEFLFSSRFTVIIIPAFLHFVSLELQSEGIETRNRSLFPSVTSIGFYAISREIQGREECVRNNVKIHTKYRKMISKNEFPNSVSLISSTFFPN